MMTAAVKSWTHNWTIVSADLVLAHVMLPLTSFRLEEDADASPDGTKPVFRVFHNDRDPALNCFAETRLRLAGGDRQPDFHAITGKEQLPLYTLATVGAYIDVLELMGPYLTKNQKEIQRLQGTIKIPCHAHGGKCAPGETGWHSPSAIDVDVHFYHFGDVVEGGRSLLVVRAPLSKKCPMNGDGTVIGYS